MNKVIILGSGKSVQEGIDQGLWDQIKPFEKWSLNSMYRIMPYLPDKQIFVDVDFLDAQFDEMVRLIQQGVIVIGKRFTNRKKYLALEGSTPIIQYETSRERENYFGRKSFENNVLYYGHMGLCGTFAISYAIACGADEIFLLGFDFGSPSINEKDTHVFQNKIADLNLTCTGAGRPEVYMHKEEGPMHGKVLNTVDDFEIFLREKDLKIWNVSLRSNIPYFPKLSYSEFFERLK